MNLSIIIPTHERVESLLFLLSSLKNQLADNLTYEVIIVANTEENALEVSREASHSGIHVLCSRSIGVNKARNLGIKKALGDIVLLLDDDCYLEDTEYLKKVLLAHSKNPDVIGIGGVYSLPEKSNAINKAYFILGMQWQVQGLYGSYTSTRLVGGNVSYKRQSLVKSGELFDESIFFGGTESEYHKRLSEKGLVTICLSHLKVLHKTLVTVESLVKKSILQGKAQADYSVEANFSRTLNQSYHDITSLWSFKLSEDGDEQEKILSYIDLYDRAFRWGEKALNYKKSEALAIIKDWSESQREQASF